MKRVEAYKAYEFTKHRVFLQNPISMALDEFHWYDSNAEIPRNRLFENQKNIFEVINEAGNT